MDTPQNSTTLPTGKKTPDFEYAADADEWLRDTLERRREGSILTVEDVDMAACLRLKAVHKVIALDVALAQSFRPIIEIPWTIEGKNAWEARVGKEYGREVTLQVAGTDTFYFQATEYIEVPVSEDFPYGKKRTLLVSAARLLRGRPDFNQIIDGRFNRVTDALRAAATFWQYHAMGGLNAPAAALVAIAIHKENWP